MTIQSRIEIDKPPSEVFEFLMDEENLSIWVTNFIRAEKLEGEPGEPGFRSRHIYSENNRQLEMVEVVNEVIENRKFAATLQGRPFHMEISNELRPLPSGGTELSGRIEYKPHSPLTALLVWLRRRKYLHRLRHDLESFKKAVELMEPES